MIGPQSIQPYGKDDVVAKAVLTIATKYQSILMRILIALGSNVSEIYRSQECSVIYIFHLQNIIVVRVFDRFTYTNMWTG